MRASIILIIVLVVLVAVGLRLGFAKFAISLLGRLVLLAFLRLVLENERGELETKVDVGYVAASLTVQGDEAILDLSDSLGVAAFAAKNEFGDESVKVVLELRGFVGTIDDPAVVGRIDVGLSTKLEAEVLDDVW